MGRAGSVHQQAQACTAAALRLHASRRPAGCLRGAPLTPSSCSCCRPALSWQVEEFLDSGVYDMEEFKRRGFVTDLLYECELEEVLKARTGERLGAYTGAAVRG